MNQPKKRSPRMSPRKKARRTRRWPVKSPLTMMALLMLTKPPRLKVGSPPRRRAALTIDVTDTDVANGEAKTDEPKAEGEA